MVLTPSSQKGSDPLLGSPLGKTVEFRSREDQTSSSKGTGRFLRLSWCVRPSTARTRGRDGRVRSSSVVAPVTSSLDYRVPWCRCSSPRPPLYVNPLPEGDPVRVGPLSGVRGNYHSTWVGPSAVSGNYHSTWVDGNTFHSMTTRSYS